jgi:hypothetical protein
MASSLDLPIADRPEQPMSPFGKKFDRVAIESQSGAPAF